MADRDDKNLPAPVEKTLPATLSDEQHFKEWKKRKYRYTISKRKLCLAAAEENELEALRYLIKQGYQGEVMHRACDKNDRATLLCLIKAGANPEQKNSEGESVLYRAIHKSHFEIVKMLVEEAQANVNVRIRKYQFTPLMLAASDGRVKIMRYLISKGADPLLTTTDGKTANHFARTKHQYDAMLLLNGKEKNVLEEIKSDEQDKQHGKNGWEVSCEQGHQIAIRTTNMKQSATVITEIFNFSAKTLTSTISVGGNLISTHVESFEQVAPAFLQEANRQLQSGHKIAQPKLL